MTGQGFYAHWMAANAEANCIVDGWELLEDSDRQVWEAFARRLNRTTGKIDLQLSASLTESIINDLQDAARAEYGVGMLEPGYYIDRAMLNVRALRSLLLLKETQNEAVYRGCNEEPR